MTTTTTENAVTSTNATPRKRRRADKSSTDAYADFMKRAIRAFGKKAREGDVAALAELLKLRDQLDETILESVGTYITEPYAYSWGEIADQLGYAGVRMTRQNVQQRWGRKLAERGITPARKVGAQPTALR